MSRKQKDGIYTRSDSRYFWASFVDASGKRVRKSTRVEVDSPGAEQEAEALLTKWKFDAHQVRMWGAKPEASDYTFDEVVLTYLNAKKSRAKRDRRLDSLKSLYPYFSEKRMRDISDFDVKDYIRERLKVVQPGTVNREVGVMCAACNFCQHELGWDIPNPANKKKLPEPEGRVRWVTLEESNRAIAKAEENQLAPWLADFMRLCFYSGMRKSEATGLTWDRVDLTRRTLLLDAGSTKSNKRRSVPLHDIAVKALAERWKWHSAYCPDSPWVFCRKNGKRIVDMRRSFNSAIRDAGIEDFHQHDQRHTLASWMVMSGTELIKVRDMLGHSSVEMTQRYAHLHPEALREALDNLQPARFSHVVNLDEKRATKNRLKNAGNQ